MIKKICSIKFILCAFLTSVSLSVSGNISNHTVFFKMLSNEINGIGLDKLIVIIALSIFYYKFQTIFSKASCWITHALSGLFAFFMLIGLSYSALNNWDFIFASKKQFLIAIIVFAGFFILFDFCLSLLYRFLSLKKSYDFRKSHKFPDIIEKHYFLFAFLFLVVLWAPYLIVHLPGSVPYDGYRQLNTFYGIEPISKHHPWVLTLLFGFLMEIGKAVSDNLGVFLITASLFFINALCYAAVCSMIKKWKAPFWFNCSTLIFFAVLPVFGAYSQVVMKDGVFSAFFVLFMAQYIDFCILFIEKKESNHFYKKLVQLLCIELIVCLTRNNGFYMVLVADLLLFFFFLKGKEKFAFLLSFCLILSYYCIDNRLADTIGIAPGSEKEMLSVPFQQTARYLRDYPNEVKESEEYAIDAILDYHKLAENYEPEISDHVKDTFNNNSSAQDLLNYFKAWFSMFLRHPDVYFQATFNNTYGYYYPFHNCDALGAYQFYIQGEPLAKGNLNIHYILPEDVRNFVDGYAQLWLKLPGLAQIMNPGTYTWLLLILIGYLLYKHEYRRILSLAAPFLNIAICVVSPVNGYLRYAIPLIACTPLLIYWCIRQNQH